MKIVPILDRVLIEPFTPFEKNVGGIILPAEAQEKTQLAKIVAIGSQSVVSNGKLQIAEGDIVLYSKFAGVEIKFENKKLLVIREPDILAIIKGEQDE